MSVETLPSDSRGSSVAPHVSVCIVSFNTRDLLRGCLQSIAGATRSPVEVIVVDNASHDGSTEMVRAEFPGVGLMCQAENRGFAAAANQAMAVARGRYLLLLNPDTVLPTGGIDRLVEFLDANPTVGLCAPTLLYPDGRFQCCGYRFPTFTTEFREVIGERFFRGPFRRVRPRPPDRPAQVDWACGACLLARRAMIDRIGVFDERFFLYGEELDWCGRARQAGWSVWAVPSVTVVHYLGQSAAVAGTWAKAYLLRTRLQYYRKHRGWLYAAAVNVLYLSRAVAQLISNRPGAGVVVRALVGRPVAPAAVVPHGAPVRSPSRAR